MGLLTFNEKGQRETGRVSATTAIKGGRQNRGAGRRAEG